MEFPHSDNIGWETYSHGSGTSGFYRYHYHDCNDLGISVIATRKNRDVQETMKIMWVGLPNRTFPLLKDLRTAALEVTQEQVDAEKRKYPVIRKQFTCESGINKCLLCPQGYKKVAEIEVLIAHNWIEANDTVAWLCADHQYLSLRPVDLLKKLEVEVEQRRERFATLMKKPIKANEQHRDEHYMIGKHDMN